VLLQIGATDEMHWTRGPNHYCVLNTRLLPSPASKSFAIISPRNLFEDSWRTKGWRETEGCFFLPTVVYGILEGYNLIALENKP
jgi:hypothetical protein